MNPDPLDVLIAERGTTKPITAAVNAWRNNGSIYEPDAVDRMFEVIRRDLLTSDRSQSEGRMRPSSIANPCQRFHALSYSGFERDPFSEVSLGFMDSGTWGHYQWQVMLLSAHIQGFGGLTDIEVPVTYEPWKLSGSMDGLQTDGSLFELKTTGYYKYHGGRYAVGIKKSAEPTLDHLQQVNGYMKAKGVNEASIVYLSRDNNNDFIEFRVQFDQAVFDSKDAQMRATLAKIGRGELPAMLEGCQRVVDGDLFDGVSKEKKGQWEGVYDTCDFRTICPKAVL